MKILLATSEVTGLASTGGLGDVGHALPLALNQAGVVCDRIMPLYQLVRESGVAIEPTDIELVFPVGEDQVSVRIWTVDQGNCKTWLVENEPLFGRPFIYGTADAEYADNALRFIVFQKAIIALIDHLGQPFTIIHANDWQTGLLPLLLKQGNDGQGRRGNERSVFTIHNLAFQGLFSADSFALSNLPDDFFTSDWCEFYGKFNFLKSALVAADQITTVSPTYAKEIQEDPLGCGLDDLLKAADNLSGILNGVDYATWNPETDAELVKNYSLDEVSGKAACRMALLDELGLTAPDDVPVLGMVSQLSDQKGLELFEAALPEILETGARFVLLGTGQEDYHEQARGWAARWPEQVAVQLKFDLGLAHRIEAGADLFLMPSAYEPCGLNQLYSLKYGTPPIVNPTGGLADTVEDGVTGFKMTDYSSAAFVAATRRAIEVFGDPAAWAALRARAMAQDFSWDQSAQRYLNLYNELNP